MRLRYLVYTTMLLAGPLAAGQSVYNIEVEFDPRRAFLAAQATIAIDKSGGHNFYFHGELRVDSILQQGKKLSFTQSSKFSEDDYSLIVKEVEVPLEEGEAIIYYSGHFNSSKARSPSDYMRIDEQGVFLRGYAYSPWFPIFRQEPEDYLADFRLEVITPPDFRAVFAGNKLEEFDSGEKRHAIWEARKLNIFDTQITAQRYQTRQASNVHVYYYKDPASAKQADSVLAFVRNLLDDFAQLYSAAASKEDHYVIEMPRYGNISNYNVTGISQDLWNEFDQTVWPKITLAHELVHPFVQIPVPEDDPFYALVIEGFPSYWHLPVLRIYLGADWYDDRLDRVEKNYLQMKNTGKHRRGWELPPDKPLSEFKPEDIGEYKDLFILSDRVPLFFDYLRRQMGETKFQSFAQELFSLEQFRYQQFETVVYKFLPKGKAMLQTWLFSSEFPEEFRRLNNE